MSRADRVVLEAERWTCVVAPEQGGALRSLTLRGADVLRPTREEATHPFEFSNFVMAPYANRIANGCFSWAGSEVVLPPNIEGERHPLHGVAFALPCEVARSELGLVLRSKHEASRTWPWAFELTQKLSATANGFRHEVEIRNTDRAAAPAGLGFHPYFSPAVGAALTAEVDGVWVRGAEQLPVRHQEGRHLWRDVALRGPETRDDCFTGWNGHAHVRWQSGKAMEISASDNLTHLHVYAPSDRDFFCLEPVTHRPNAINGSAHERGAMHTLEPGEALTAWMCIAVKEGGRA